jgi:hypothetical protein
LGKLLRMVESEKREVTCYVIQNVDTRGFCKSFLEV